MQSLLNKTRELFFAKKVISDGESNFEIWHNFHQAVRGIFIKISQENNVDTDGIIPKIRSKGARKKMPIFNCLCGTKILIVPDLPAMSKVIKNHLVEHKKITGKCLTEEILSQGILIAISET